MRIQNQLIHSLRLSVCCLFLLSLWSSTTLQAQETVLTASEDLVTVNWFEELAEGGLTIVALGILSVLMLAFAVERLLSLRSNKFLPLPVEEAADYWLSTGDDDVLLKAAEANPSLLSTLVSTLLENQHETSESLSALLGDVAGREMEDQEQRNVPLAVIASLAPLLGLLGTMIGMIEAFKLVEVFGDEGGASLLAGSISKALITTAVGLILAIPAISLYNYFKFRLHRIGRLLEVRVEGLVRAIGKPRSPSVTDANEEVLTEPTPAYR
ncbi:MAG: MotA/TolQ/ExbB proton channel family protein [Puniceicoccaceae bacterium]